MKKISTRWLSLLVLVFAGFTIQAQTISVSDEATLIAAINTVNTSGVSGTGATITFTANIALTAALPAIGSATLNGSTNSGAPLIIDGAGFSLTANYVGTRTGSLTTGANDAVLVISGTDYVTIQGITFSEQVTNTTTAAQIENAVGIYNRSATTPFDGVQFLTVTGCTFNLNKVVANANNASIYSTNYIFGGTTSLAWATFATLPADMHREFTISNNTFNGSYNHIVYNNSSSNNGRNVSITGNTMNDYGGGASTAYGAYAIRLDGLTFNNNTTTCNATQSSTNYALFASTNCGGQQIANGNTVTLRNATTTAQSAGIYFTSIGISTSIENNVLHFGTFSALTTASIYGFYCSNTGGVATQSLLMRNNTISNEILPGGSTTTTSTLYCFYGTVSNTITGATTTIDQNTFSNNTRSGGGTVYACYQSAGYTGTISNNTINGLTWTNNTTSSVSNFYGISSPSSNPISFLTNNSISNINISGTSTSTTGVLRGISSFLTTTVTTTITGNTVSNLSYGTGTVTGTVTGIYSQSHLLSTIANNVISGLNASQAAGVVNGISTATDVTGNIYNNCISNLTTPHSTSNTGIYGINIVSGTTTNVTHNLIYLGSAAPLASTGANFGVTGVYQNATTALNLKNNIINLKGSAAGTGTFACVRRSAVGTANTKPANFNATSNTYNVTAGPWNFIYVEGTTNTALKNGYALSGLTADVTNNIGNDPAFNTGCGLYKLLMLDAGSFTEDNLVANGSCFTPSGASYAESAAITTTTPSIPLDLIGTTRGANPDMGALEFTGVGTDATAPLITYTNIPNTICTTDPIINVTISDLSGINTTAGTLPRIWFKKSTENNAYNGNTSADNGWKYTEALNTSSPFQFAIPLGLLNTPAAATDIIQYFVTAQDLASSPNVAVNIASFPAGFCPLTVALDPAAYPVGGSLKSFTILTDPVTINSVASNANLCVSGNTVLSLTGDASTGAFYQWQSSPNGSAPWTDMVGATTSTYTVTGISTTTSYRCEISCGDLVANGGTAITINNSAPVTVIVNNPSFVSTTPGTRCGTGTVLLGATPSGAGTVKWYAGPTGGTSIGSGSSFTTPTIAATTTYYATSTEGGLSGINVPSPTAGTSTFISTATGWGLRFTVNSPFDITSVQMKLGNTAAATATVQVKVTDLNDVVLYTGTNYSFPVTTSLATYTIPVGITNLAPGNYKMVMSYTNLTLAVRESSGVTFPYNSPGGECSITAGANGVTTAQTTTAYYWFYNWVISTGCESARVPVIATVTAPDPLTVNGAGSVECNNAVVPLSISSTLANYDSYIWSPVTNLYTDAAATVAYTGTSESQVYLKSATAGVNTYTVSASNSVSNCANTLPVSVTILPNSLNVTGNSDICVSGSIVLGLTPTNGVLGSNIQWKENGVDISGANSLTYTTPTLTSSTNYSADLIDANANICLTSPVATVSVNNPTITSSLGATRCGTGPLTLTAAANSGSSVNWYSTPTGGTNLAVMPYSNVPVTGFNNDIVANGVGTSSIPGVTYTFGPDGAGYHLIDNTFKYVSTNALPTCFMPANNLAPSLLTPGLTYQFQSYSANNALTISNASTTYSNPLPSSATLTLSSPASYANLKVLYETVVNAGALSVDAMVTFTDATTQSFNGNYCVNWFTPSAPAYSGMGRTTPTGTIQCGTTPNMFELNLPINTANQGKLVQSITFSIPTVITTGTNPFNVNYFHAMAVGGNAPSTGSYTTPSISSTTTYYAAPVSGGTGPSQTVPGGNTWDQYQTTGSFLTSALSSAANIFDAAVPIVLKSVDIYPSAAIGSPFTIEVRQSSSTGALIASYNGVTTVQNVTTPSIAQTVPLNFNIPAGTGYVIGFASTATNPSCWRSGSSTHAYPYSIPGVFSVTGASASGNATSPTLIFQYFTYNFKVATTCEGARVPVVATVTTAPTLTITPTANICTGGSASLTVSSSNDPNYDYTWTPGSLTGASVSVNPAANTTYTVSAIDVSTGCVNSGTTSVVVSLVPTGITAGASVSTACDGSTFNLTSGPSSYPPTILSENFDGGALGAWTAVNSSTGGTNPALVIWTNRANGYAYSSDVFTGNQGTNFALANSDAAGSGVTTLTTLTSPSFSTIGYTTMNLAYKHYYRHITAAGAFVEVSTNGTTWTTVQSFAATTGTAAAFANATVNLDAYVGLPNVYLRYRFAGTWYYYWAIDDIQVTGTLPNYTFGWTSSPAGYTSSVQNPTGVTLNGTTTYTVTATGAGGCTATNTVTVTANPLPTVNVSTTTPSLCTGGTTNAVIDATGTSTSYDWMPGSLTGASISVLPTSTTTYTVTGTGSNGCTASATQTIDVNPCNTTLNLNVWLEGYFDGTSAMAEVMLNQNYLPTPPAGDVDDITVELRELNLTTFEYDVIPNGSAVARLHTDGTATVVFPAAISGSYYIVINHRNHLQTYSHDPVVIGSGTNSYNFKTGAAQAAGSNMALLANSEYGLFSGDITQDGYVDSFDYGDFDTDSQNNVSGTYVATDLNGDGYVDSFDYGLLDTNTQNNVTVQFP